MGCNSSSSTLNNSKLPLENKEKNSFSNNNNKKNLNPLDFLLKSIQNEVVIKSNSMINNEQFLIEECEKSSIFLLDCIGSMFIDYCKDCYIVIGPISSRLEITFFYFFISIYLSIVIAVSLIFSLFISISHYFSHFLLSISRYFYFSLYFFVYFSHFLSFSISASIFFRFFFNSIFFLSIFSTHLLFFLFFKVFLLEIVRIV